MAASDLIFYAGGDVFSQYGTLSKRTSIQEDVAETFTRTGTAYYVDRAGVLRIAEANVLRTEWTGSAFDVPTLLLEAARTNVVLRNRDMTNGAWTKSSCTAALDQTGADGGMNTASSLTATSGNATCLQAITLSNSARFQSTYVKRITGSGTINMTMDNGSTWTAITVTSDWTRVSIPTQTITNPTVGFRIVTNSDAIAVDFVQNENGTFQSSAIATVGSTVTRNAELLSFPFPFKPQGMTVYVKFLERGTSLGTSDRILQIGQSDNSTPRLLILESSGVYQASHGEATSVTSTAAAAPSIGDTVELRMVVASTGAVTLGQSLNTAAEAIASTSSALALSATWSDILLHVGSYGNAADIGTCAFQSLKVARGTKTMAEMRALGV